MDNYHIDEGSIIKNHRTDRLYGIGYNLANSAYTSQTPVQGFPGISEQFAYRALPPVFLENDLMPLTPQLQTNLELQSQNPDKVKSEGLPENKSTHIDTLNKCTPNEHRIITSHFVTDHEDIVYLQSITGVRKRPHLPSPHVFSYVALLC